MLFAPCRVFLRSSTSCPFESPSNPRGHERNTTENRTRSAARGPDLLECSALSARRSVNIECRVSPAAAPGRPSVSCTTRAKPGPLHFFEKVRPSLYPTALVIEVGDLDDSSLGMPTRGRLHDGGRYVAIASADVVTLADRWT